MCIFSRSEEVICARKMPPRAEGMVLLVADIFVLSDKLNGRPVGQDKWQVSGKVNKEI